MSLIKRTEKDVMEIMDEAESEPEEIVLQNKGNFDYSVSTGSTLLDLSISGGKVREGGIPGGIIMEVFGPPSVGKTAVLSEICASAQNRGGRTRFLDPEARLDAEYSRIYGVDIDKTDYHRPDTVTEVFDLIYGWDVPDAPKGACNTILTDSLAALSSDAELSDKGDKMAGRRIAKDFSEGLRKTCRLIRHNNFLIACSNQLREGDFGDKTPGGKGIPYYASLRISTKFAKGGMITKKVKFHGKDQEKIIGITSVCEVTKSSIDDPFRKAIVYILFNYGIDDIRGNLQWYKNVTGTTTYTAYDKDYQSMRDAINHVEKEELSEPLRQMVIRTWHELEEKFREKRKPKSRG
jgi:RecA/RadA recombinase